MAGPNIWRFRGVRQEPFGWKMRDIMAGQPRKHMWLSPLEVPHEVDRTPLSRPFFLTGHFVANCLIICETWEILREGETIATKK